MVGWLILDSSHWMVTLSPGYLRPWGACPPAPPHSTLLTTGMGQTGGAKGITWGWGCASRVGSLPWIPQEGLCPISLHFPAKAHCQ